MILAGDEPIYIHRRTANGVDSYGNPSFTASQELVRNCLIGFSGSAEPVDVSRDPIDAKLTIYFPHGTVIQEGDRFEIREQIWEKDGDPSVYDTIGTFEVGVIVNVRRRRG
jgi:hypothetical protein